MTTQSLNKRTPAVRFALTVGALFTAWHIAASFLWIAPVTPLRELVPGNMLSSYMLPWYGQSWSVFAPAPINGDERLSVRAVLAANDGTETMTEWVSATDVELSLSRHNLFPPRAHGLGTHQAATLRAASGALTQEQRDTAMLNYFKGDDWLGRMQQAMNGQGNDPAVANYIVQERYADAYATQVALAVWGDSVVRVQYEANRQDVVPFELRNDPKAERPAPQVVSTGWRGLIEMPGQSREHFADLFRPAYERLTK